MPLRLPPPLVRKSEPVGNKLVSPEAVRTWPDRTLASELAMSQMHPYARIVLESELRVREAWRSPDTWAMAISIVSLLASILALATKG